MAKEQQLIRRRVYNDKGDLLREGYVPKDVQNTRDALMAYWEKEDATLAEKEAKEAEEALQEVSTPEEPNALELVGAMEGRVAGVESLVAELQSLKQASPEEVLRGTQQIARGAGMAAEVESVALLSISRLEQAKASALELFNKLEGSVKQIQTMVSEFLVESRDSLNRTNAEMIAKTASQIQKRLIKFELDVAKLRGPKGSQGRIGQGMIAGAGRRPETRPDGSEWALGDSFLNTAVEGYTLEYLSAEGWSRPVRMVPEPKLINAQQNVLDMAPRQSTSVQIVQPGSGGSGGGERLMINNIARGTTAAIANSSNWVAAGIDSPRAGTILISIEDTASAQRGAVQATFVAGNAPASTRITEYSMVGTLLESGTNSPDIDLDVVVTGGLSIPPGVTITGTPIAGGACELRLRVGANLTTGGPYLVSGVVIWDIASIPRAYGVDDVMPKPLWVWA